MLAAALALAITAAPVASGHQMGGSGGDLSAGNSVPLTPHMVGLPGGSLNPTVAQQAAVVLHRSGEGVPLTPHEFGLPGGTLNPDHSAQQTARFQGRHAVGPATTVPVAPVTRPPYTFGLGGVELSRWEAQRIALRRNQSGDPIGWLIGIGAVAFVVIGTALATRRQSVEKPGSSQTVQTA
jgi:hypothetical protein